MEKINEITITKKEEKEGLDLVNLIQSSSSDKVIKILKDIKN